MTDPLDQHGATTVEEAAASIRLIFDAADAHGGVLENTTIAAGSYEGLPPQIALLSDGRFGQLLAPIAFIRPAGDRWPVPTGSSLDGASIPRPLWSIIGGPFEGRYRDASIVHDHYCIVQTQPWRDTHRMFLEAMLCSGVGGVQAKVMYYAVHRFGPRWAVPGLESLQTEPVTPPLRAADAAALVRDAATIADDMPDADAIERLADLRTAQATGGAA